MKLNHCEYDLETKFVEGCNSCRKSYFRTCVPVKIGYLTIWVMRLFTLEVCPLGLTGGKLIYAQSLLPKEEQELEVIQRYRSEQSTNLEQSLDQHIETAITSSMHTGLAQSFDTHFALGADSSFSFGPFDASIHTALDISQHMSQEFWRDVTESASKSVSSHYAVSMDTKTESETQNRRLRKISNPNPCRVVTYFFKQLEMKYSIKVTPGKTVYDIAFANAKAGTRNSYDERQFRGIIKGMGLDEQIQSKIDETIKTLTNDPNWVNGKGLYSGEFCVSTNSIVAEPKVSHCSICTDDDCDCNKDCSCAES